MRLESYRDLKVWQKGMQVAEDCYRMTRSFSRSEIFGLTSQIRRAAASVPANIAEGYGRGHRAEYRQFLRVAIGSLNELETHLTLSVRVEIATADAVAPLIRQCDELGRMLGSLLRSLEQSH